MTKKRLAALLLLMLFIALLAFTACSGTNTMLMGRWSMTGIGDATGQNPQSYPLPVVVDIYPDGHVDFLGDKFGTYTKDRDTFSFTYTDGGQSVSGSFRIQFVTDSNTQQQTMQLTIFPDDTPESYIFSKQMNLPDLQKFLKSQAAASASPVAGAATPAPAATPAASAS